MQQYYIPCVQQDRSQGRHQESAKAQAPLRRSTCQALRKAESLDANTPLHTEWQSTEQYLTSQTLPSRTSWAPSPDSADQGDRVRFANRRHDSKGRLNSVKTDGTQLGRCGANGNVELLTGATSSETTLPSRPKLTANRGVHQGKVSREVHAPQAIIQETAVRSRVARRAPDYEIDTLKLNAIETVGKVKNGLANSRCHARRRACVDSNPAAPPKLRRDTDCTDAIVKLIVCFSTKLVHAIWSQSSNTPRSANGLNGAGVLPLRVFIQETLRRSKTSYSTLQVALYYLVLLKPYVVSEHSRQDAASTPCRALQCGRRMFLTALILASKYLQDRNYSSRAWSKISGLPITEVNENERRYLNLIQFNLHMKKETFDNWSKIVLTLCKVGEPSMNHELSQDQSRSHRVAIGQQPDNFTTNQSQPGSDSWWTRHLRSLSAELVEDSTRTEAFLASLTSTEADSIANTEQLTASLVTPPSSPEIADNKCTDTDSPVSVSESVAFDTCDVQGTAGSPASISSLASLPSRPNLPNLPTPQTTPRYHNVLPLPKGMAAASLRCKISSQALLGLDKHAIHTANLERCPPPRPRHFDQSFSTSTSIMTSPESMISDVSSCTTRSRSSSISSNSSIWWPSSTQSSIDDVHARLPCVRKENIPASVISRPIALPQLPASYSFYHSGRPNLVGLEEEGAVFDRSLGSQSEPCGSSLLKVEGDGYSCGAYEPAGRTQSCPQQDASEALASVSGRESVQAMLCPAEADARLRPAMAGTHQSTVNKQKRGRSSVSEEFLQSNVRQLLLNDGPFVQVIESPFGVAQQDREKETQRPERDWASFKKPVLNRMHTKRFALEQCVSDYKLPPSAVGGFLSGLPMVN